MKDTASSFRIVAYNNRHCNLQLPRYDTLRYIHYIITINGTRMKLPKLLESDGGPAIGSPHGDIFTQEAKKDPTRLQYQSSVSLLQ